MLRHWLTRRLGRPLVLLVGVGFLALEWLVTTYAFERSVDSVRTIFDNAMPSITYLSEVQSKAGELARDMRRLDYTTDAAALAQTRQEVTLLVRSLGRLQREYEQFPIYPHEPVARDELREALEGLSATARSVAGERDPALRRRRLGEEFYSALDAANAVVRDLLRVNAEQASYSARGVIAAHEAATGQTLVLTVGLNVVLLALWWLLGRQIAKTERERARRIEDLDSFGGRVAHDLKAPLSTIVMASQLMRQDASLDERVARSLARIERASTRMSCLIDGLLAFARASAEVDTHARASVAEVLASIHATIAPTFESERATLTVEVEPDLWAGTSDGVLSSIAQNLIRNAVTHLGEVMTREVRVRARTVSPMSFELEVTDTGPGIPADVVRRLFKPFERGSTTAAGHGLGLATVKRLVDGHRGSIVVDTQVGRGTTFRVRLPRASPGA